jgi:hypothetical protein
MDRVGLHGSCRFFGLGNLGKAAGWEGAGRRDAAIPAARHWVPDEMGWQTSSRLLAQGVFLRVIEAPGASREMLAFLAAGPLSPCPFSVATIPRGTVDSGNKRARLYLFSK